ncbi:MAG: hypothetical protein L0323_04100 [Planctomycetes bacterium]|nr:hypothetical protein [Planctomycetota bacterium]
MALGAYGTDLVAGGFFTSAGGAPASHIAKWDGASWSPLGSGIGNIVYALTVYEGSLVAGGLFSTAGGVPANDVARWDGTSWSAFGSGIGLGPFGYVLDLAVYNGDLIAGGFYTTAGGAPANNVAKWNGTAWSALGSGTSNSGSTSGVFALTTYQTDLIAGGIFNSAGGTGVGHIAAWNEAFSAYGVGCPGTAGAVPALSGVGTPEANAVAGISVTNGKPSGTGAVFLGSASASTPIQGCSFLLGGAVLPPFGVSLDGSGAFGVTWTLPATAGTGEQVFFQYGGLDPQSPNGVFSASNGLKVTFQ